MRQKNRFIIIYLFGFFIVSLSEGLLNYKVNRKKTIVILGIEWKKIFSHTHPADLGEAGFFVDHTDAMNKNADDEYADMFSILDQLEHYRSCNGTFHFKLCYPELSNNFSFPCNEWIQFNNNSVLLLHTVIISVH